MRDQFRVFGGADIEKINTRRLHPRVLANVVGVVRVAAAAADLIAHGHHVADDVERIGAHFVVGQVGLNDYFGIARVGNIHPREILGRRFVRQPQYAPAALCRLHVGAFTEAPEAAELVVREQLHVERQRI